MDLPQIVQLRCPVPPSVNAAYRNTSAAERATAKRRGKNIGPRVKTAAYEAWERSAGMLLNVQRIPQLKGNVGVDIRCPLSKQRDVDNTIKLTLDLLVKVHILKDDSQVDELSIVRLPPLPGQVDAFLTMYEIPEFSAGEPSSEQIMRITRGLQHRLAGRPVTVQGAVIADLLAIWLAGHHVAGDSAATQSIRATLLAEHLTQVAKLVEINAREIGTTV